MGKKPLMFKQFCNNIDKANFKIDSFTQSRELAKVVFGKNAVYSKGGYFTNIVELGE
jgi:hypothetical protein